MESTYDEDILALEAGAVSVGTLDTNGNFLLVLIAVDGLVSGVVRVYSIVMAYMVARSCGSQLLFRDRARGEDSPDDDNPP